MTIPKFLPDLMYYISSIPKYAVIDYTFAGFLQSILKRGAVRQELVHLVLPAVCSYHEMQGSWVLILQE